MFFIERGFQDARTTAGLTDYQTRDWRAWHPHGVVVMLAIRFQQRERLRHREEDPLLRNADIVELLR